jgi:hypothetical protein
LALQLTETVNLCVDALGGGDKQLRIELGTRVSLEMISKWRKFQKYEVCPSAEDAAAMAEILRDNARKLADPDRALHLAGHVESICARLRDSKRGPRFVGVEDFVTQTRSDLAEALGSIESPSFAPDVLPMLWEALTGDFQSVVSHPSRLVHDLTYTIEVSGRDDGWHVKTKNDGTRTFPGVDTLFVSYCSTPEGLDHEYKLQNSGCIAREVVAESPGETLEAWTERVRAHTCMLEIDASVCAEVEGDDVGYEGPGFVARRYFDVGGTSVGAHPTPTTIWTEFVLPLETDHFPIHLTSYYCIGRTTIEMTVLHHQRDLVLRWSSFLQLPHSAPLTPSSRGPGHVRLVTSHRTVLAPGSGVFFRWGGVETQEAQS